MSQSLHELCEIRGWTFRSATWQDVDAIVDLHNESFRALIGTNETTRQQVESWFEWPGTDLNRDTRLVFEHENKAIAWAAMYDPEPPYVSDFYDVVIHPDFWAEDLLWDALLVWCEGRALSCVEMAEQGVRVCAHARGNATDTHRHSAFTRAGFHVTRSNTLMRIGLDAPIEEPSWPDGIRLRAFDLERDFVRFAAAHQEAFRDHWGHVEQPLAAHTEELRREFASWEESFQADLWFLAMDGDALAGATGIYPHLGGDYTRGYTYHVFVRRPWRGKGLAKALLRHSFRVLQERGYGTCELHVDSENFTGANQLYESVGMCAVRISNLYERELRFGRDSVTRAPSGTEE